MPKRKPDDGLTTVKIKVDNCTVCGASRRAILKAQHGDTVNAPKADHRHSFIKTSRVDLRKVLGGTRQ